MADAPPSVDTELENLIRARYPLIYIVSWEEKRVEESIREVCQRRGKKMLVWTYTMGMAGNIGSKDPIAALDYVINAPDQSVFVLKDFHPFINDPMVTRRLRDLVYALKQSYKTVVLLSPFLKLPPELEKEVTVVDYQLPTIQDLDRLLESIIQSVRGDTRIDVNLTPLEREQVLKSASGLTSIEAENVFAKSLVEKRRFDIDVILGEKEQIIRKSGILEYFRASDSFADVGGMDLLKNWMEQRTTSFNEDAKKYGLPEPKGILLLGVQGCGKSLIAKSIASLWRLPLLRLDVGKIFAGIVGSSEENMRKAISTAESVSPCVAGDTRITLADGSEKTIQALYDGDETALDVLAMDDRFRQVPVRVRAITRREAPDLYTVRMRHATLQATGNHLHPVLRDGVLTWTRTDALQAGDHVAIPRQIPTAKDAPALLSFLPDETRLYGPDALAYARLDVQTPQRRYVARVRGSDYVKVGELVGIAPVWKSITRFVVGRGGTTDSVLPRMPETVSPSLGYLMGLIGSDGFLGKRGRVGFVNTDKTLHHLFGEVLCRLFGLEATVRQNDAPSKNSALVGTDGNSVFAPCYTSFVDNRLLRDVLRSVEEQLLTLPLPVLRSFVRGYLDGDGYVSECKPNGVPKVVITSKIARQNQILRSVLHRVGFAASNPGSSNIEITGWQNVRRFIREIGSSHPMKQARMEQWLAANDPGEVKDRTDAIPVGNLLREARASVGMGSQHFLSASSSLLHRWEHGVGHPNRERLQSVVAELREWAVAHGKDGGTVEALATLADAPTQWTPVLSVEQTETPEYVYDLCCDKVHNFVANGVVTHNCILWLDELEKGFAGTQSSPFSDGGTTSRVFGTFITWLQDKKAACFVVATSNDVSQLPPELMRKGRFDEIFFVDLPAAPERREIFAIHLRKRGRDVNKFDLDRLAKLSAGYSGAEIEQVVVAALFSAYSDGKREVGDEDMVQSMRDSVPLSVTMQEGIQKLRDWAETRARPSSSTTVEPMHEWAETAEFAEATERQTRRERGLPSMVLPQPSDFGVVPAPSPYTIEDDTDDIEDEAAGSFNAITERLKADEQRIATLEAKTSTGLDTLMGEIQNVDRLKKTVPKPPNLAKMEEKPESEKSEVKSQESEAESGPVTDGSENSAGG